MPKVKSFGAIDVGHFDKIAHDHPELKPDQIKTSTNSTLARGQMTVTQVRDGVMVMRGSLRGLRDTVIDNDALPGILVEARLAGDSSSHSVEGTAKSVTMSAGQGHILGVRHPARWCVSLPAQEEFEAVSLRFPSEFLARVGSLHPEVARRMQRTLDNEDFHLVDLNTSLKQISRELLETPEGSDFSKVRIEALALSMLAHMYELVDGPDQNESLRSASVMPLVEAFVGRSAPRIWTAKAIADALGLSPTKIKRACVAERGKPIGTYLAELRLEAAKAMLAGPLSILEIARAAGYGSAEALSKAFLRRYGVTPNGYRDEVRRMDSKLV
ncbi:MAG: helix-turn-helix transcriptional regulator [Pseudomonadota bacterium]